MMKKLSLSFICLLLSAILKAQTPTLVKDINPGNVSSNNSLNGIVYNNKYLFAATDAAGGEELWITDASTGGTYQVKDIHPGSGDSNPHDFTIYNNEVYFVANDGSHGFELWKTDGTNAGTIMLYDFYPGTDSGFIVAFGNYSLRFEIVWIKNGYFYFTANSHYNNGIDDLELWKSDGTPGGTSRVRDINPGNDGSYPRDFTEYNGLLYFVALDGVNGFELWKTDGTNSGTQQVYDIYPGTDSGFMNSSGNNQLLFRIVWINNGYFYFTARSYYQNGYDDIELWKSDGTTAGTSQVKDIYAGNMGSIPESFQVFNGNLYFEAFNATNGRELWKTDGTTAGTQMVKDIYPGTGNAFGYTTMPFKMVWINNGYFYFTARSNEYNGYYDTELWKSDGTAAGTSLVKDIYSGYMGSQPQNFEEFNGQLYFEATDAANGRELWKTDGTTSGTQLVKDIYPGTESAFNYASIYFRIVWIHNGYFYFTARSNYMNGYDDVELWKSDGTTSATTMVKDIYPGYYGSDPENFIVHGNELIFAAVNSNGRELWKTDGTTAGTQMIKDIYPGSGNGIELAYSYFFIGYNGSLYFEAYEQGSSDNELWKTDGTLAGTVKLLDIYNGPNGSYANSFTVLPNDNVIFQAMDATHAYELWTLYMPGVTSVEDISDNTAINIYPVPNNGEYLNIQLPVDAIANVSVTDITGKNVFNVKACSFTKKATEKINLPSLKPGLYYLQITDDHQYRWNRLFVVSGK